MMSGCLVGLTSIFYYGAMQYLPASLTIILMFQFVWIGVILESAFTRNQIKNYHYFVYPIDLEGSTFRFKHFKWGHTKTTN